LAKGKEIFYKQIFWGPKKFGKKRKNLWELLTQDRNRSIFQKTLFYKLVLGFQGSRKITGP
jgi:hypothetical protein